MAHAYGAHIGGIRSIEDIRLRCYCCPVTDCWHIRSAHGKSYEPGQMQKLWVYTLGSMTATAASYLLGKGKPVPKGHAVYRKCKTHDCVNPDHLNAMPRGKVNGIHAKRGKYRTQKHLNACKHNSAKNSKRTPEITKFILESPLTGSEVARQIGMSQSRVNAIRKEARKRVQMAPNSIFALADAANSAKYRGKANG